MVDAHGCNQVFHSSPQGSFVCSLRYGHDVVRRELRVQKLTVKPSAIQCVDVGRGCLGFRHTQIRLRRTLAVATDCAVYKMQPRSGHRPNFQIASAKGPMCARTPTCGRRAGFSVWSFHRQGSWPTGSALRKNPNRGGLRVQSAHSSWFFPLDSSIVDPVGSLPRSVLNFSKAEYASTAKVSRMIRRL